MSGARYEGLKCIVCLEDGLVIMNEGYVASSNSFCKSKNTARNIDFFARCVGRLGEEQSRVKTDAGYFVNDEADSPES